MVEYIKAIKAPFNDLKKLFAGIFIILGLLVVMYAGMFFLLFQGSVEMIVSQKITTPAYLIVVYYALIVLLSAIPFSFFMRYGINAAKHNLIILSWKKDVSGMFKEGVQMIGLYFIYYIPLFIVNYLIMGSLKLNSQDPQAALALFQEKMPLILGILVPLSILLGYLLPVVLLRFMETKKFTSGFDFNIIFRKAFSLIYLKAFLMSILISIGWTILFTIIIFILAITVIGILLFFLLFPALFYILIVTTMGILGQAYGEVK